MNKKGMKIMGTVLFFKENRPLVFRRKIEPCLPAGRRPHDLYAA